ncbi:MAG: efflux RND transporter periplasmic adaptor subunit, partial [Spirochaetota bacterium]
MKRKKSSPLVIADILAALAATAVLLGGCTGSGPGTGQEPAGTAGRNPGRQQSVSSVTVTEVREQRMEGYLQLDGDVAPETSVLVYPDIAGKVSRIMVRAGDYARKGQTLALVDPSRPGRIYKESPVQAPIAGTVTDVLADTGQNVSTGVPLVELGSLDTLQVETRVPERFIGSVAVGTRAELTFEPYPGKRFPARVVEMSPVLSPASRTLRVKLAFEDSGGLVKAGMFAEIFMASVAAIVW